MTNTTVETPHQSTVQCVLQFHNYNTTLKQAIFLPSLSCICICLLLVLHSPFSSLGSLSPSVSFSFSVSLSPPYFCLCLYFYLSLCFHHGLSLHVSHIFLFFSLFSLPDLSLSLSVVSPGLCCRFVLLAELGGPLSCSAVLVITISLRMTVSRVEAPFHQGLVGKTLAKFCA